MNFEVGQAIDIEFAFSDADQRRFSEISSDYNRLHLDAEFARKKGFQHQVVYGGLIIAKVSQAVGMHFPGDQGIWTSVKMTFRNPLYVDEVALLHAEISHLTPSLGSLILDIKVHSARDVICTGTATALTFGATPHV